MSHNNHDDDDSSLFRRMMKDVKPLKKNLKTPQYHIPKQPVIKKSALPEFNPTPVFFLSDPYDCTIGPDTILSFKQHLSVKRFKQLKHGQIPLDNRLDLHGLRLEEAKIVLPRFIINQYRQGHRSLLIIHGKGGMQNEISILKSHVHHWLKQIPEVLAFHSACPKDGGTGAVYVLLKKFI